MAKPRPVRRKSRANVPGKGAPCVVFLISGLVLALLFVYYFLKNASG